MQSTRAAAAIAVVGLAVILLSGCSCPGTLEETGGAPPLGLDEAIMATTGIAEVEPFPDVPPASITARPGKGAEFTSIEDNQGTLFTIRNDSNKAVIILRVEPITNAGAASFFLSRFSGGAGGFTDPASPAAAERAEPDAYVWDIGPANVCKRPFHSCLLLPGESFVLGCDSPSLTRFPESAVYFPVASEESFAVTFLATDGPYEPSPNDAGSWGIYVFEGFDGNTNGTFLPIDLERWRARRPYAKEWPPNYEQRDRLCVVLKRPPRNAWLSMLQVSFAWKGGRSLDDVRTQLAMGLHRAPGDLQFCYSSALDSYLVSENERTLVFSRDRLDSPEETLLPFPAAMLRRSTAIQPLRLEIEGGEVPYKGRRYSYDDRPEPWRLWDA